MPTYDVTRVPPAASLQQTKSAAAAAVLYNSQTDGKQRKLLLSLKNLTSVKEGILILNTNRLRTWTSMPEMTKLYKEVFPSDTETFDQRLFLNVLFCLNSSNRFYISKITVRQ